MKKDEYFFCYSKNVSDYLQKNGFEYITIAFDVKKQRMFSLYKITEELNTCLKAYKN